LYTEIMSETKTFLEPKKIFDAVSLDRGSIVADFGSGAGHFSLEAARRVGAEGKVYALDILPQALESIASRAAMENLDNIETRRVNFETPGGSTLEDASVNFAVVKDALFMNENREAVLEEVFRVLSLGSRILVIEWSEGDVSIGPPKENRIPKEHLLKMAGSVGFSGEQEVAVGDYHYGMVFRK